MLFETAGTSEATRTMDTELQDEEALYEEMEEEDFDYPLDDLAVSSRPANSEPKVECLVCGRSQSGSTRLFKWPRIPRVRSQWCTILEVNEEQLMSNFERSFICSFHFDPEHFFYSENRIFWAPGAIPRYRRRRPPYANPFPWEITRQEKPAAAKKQNRVTHTSKAILHSNVLVHFRQSNFKVQGKKRHPVAVISHRSNPSIYYEFSLNRRSTVDGSGFYACLGCRKAKIETREKDTVRTIHLNGTELLSRSDPFSGHHFACQPLQDSPPLQLRKAQMGLTMQQLVVNEEIVYSDQPWTQEDEGTAVVMDEGGRFFPVETVRLEEEPCSVTANKIRKYDRRQLSQRPHCHVCGLYLPSTVQLITHLQEHISSLPSCNSCGSQLTPEHKPRTLRKRLCTRCHKRLLRYKV